jgi:hypothetical protein
MLWVFKFFYFGGNAKSIRFNQNLHRFFKTRHSVMRTVLNDGRAFMWPWISLGLLYIDVRLLGDVRRRACLFYFHTLKLPQIIP